MSENIEVKTFTAPFSTSDLFLYLIPGASLLILILFAEMRVEIALGGHDRASPIHLPALHALRQLADQHTKVDTFVFAALLFVVLIIVSYVIGHVVSSISSFAIDRTLIYRGHGYPFRYILGLRTTAEHESPSEAFYRGAFLWFNVAILGLYVSRTWTIEIPFIWNERKWLTTVAAVPFVVGCVTKLAYEQFRRRQHPKTWAYAPRWAQFLLYWFAKPYDILADRFDHLTSSQKPFAEGLQQRYQKRFSAIFGFDCDTCGTDAYWMTYCAVMGRSPESYKLLVAWLHLYEFARNLSTTFYVAAVYVAMELSLQMSRIALVPDFRVLRVIPVIYLCVAAAMLVRYYYLYACYYTKFLFRAFIALPDDSPREGAIVIPRVSVSASVGGPERASWHVR